MANIVGDIAIQIGADIAPLVSNLGRAKRAVTDFGESAGTVASTGMGKWSTAGLAMASAAAAASVGIGIFVKQTLDQAGALNDASLATGVHVAQLQAMTQVAEEASVSGQSLISSLSKMQNNIASLSAGTAAQVAAFDSLGLSIDDLQGKSADQQFAIIAASIETIEDPAMRTAAAMDVFGKSGADLIPMMTGYSAAVADVAAKQRDLGVALTDEQAAQLDQLGDTFGRLKMSATGLGNQLLITFGPALIDAVNFVAGSLAGLNSLFQDMKNVLETTNAEAKMMALGAAAEQSASYAEVLAGTLGDIADGTIAQALTSQADSIRMAFEAYQSGAISAEAYKEKIELASKSVVELLGYVKTFNSDADMGDAIAQAKAYGAALLNLLGISEQLRNPVSRPDSGGSNAPAAVPKPGISRPDAGGSNFSYVTTPEDATSAGTGGRYLEEELRAMQDQFAAKSELVDQEYQDSLAKLREFRDAKMVSEAEYNALEADLAKQHADDMRGIQEQSQSQKLSAISGAFGDLSSLMQTNNKSLFQIGKAAAIASATIDGYEAATASFKFGAKIGGPMLGAAFMAASLARTGVMISNIASTQFGGGSGGGASSGSASAAASGGGATPAAASAPAQAYITINGSSVSTSSLQALVNDLNKAYDQGYTLKFAQGAA